MYPSWCSARHSSGISCRGRRCGGKAAGRRIELARLLRDPVFRDLKGVPEGNDRPVLLHPPGFLAGDGTSGR